MSIICLRFGLNWPSSRQDINPCRAAPLAHPLLAVTYALKLLKHVVGGHMMLKLITVVIGLFMHTILRHPMAYHLLIETGKYPGVNEIH